MNRVDVKPGDLFFIPAGTVHALGAGIEVVEVQQTSDITYRIYDWDRVDAEGKSRELHTALAVDAINFEADADLLYKPYELQPGGEVTAIDSPYFTMAIMDVANSRYEDLSSFDSFVVYIALSGNMKLRSDAGEETLAEGELVLIPAEMPEIEIEGEGRLMKIYIK